MTSAEDRDGRVVQGLPISRRHLAGIVERLRRQRGNSQDRLATQMLIDEMRGQLDAIRVALVLPTMIGEVAAVTEPRTRGRSRCGAVK